jgi:hypothetical protein
MADNNSSPTGAQELQNSIERIDEVVGALSLLHNQFGVLRLAIDGLWFADTNMGKRRRTVTGNDFDNLEIGRFRAI